MYEPLKITAYLGSPVISDYSLPIDGILLSLACEKSYGILDAQAPRVVSNFDPTVTPLYLHQWDNKWIYEASFAIWSNVANDIHFFTRRHNETEAEILSNKKQWDTGRGEYRNLYQKIATRHTPMITWYVVGIKAKIEELLKDCDTIGKKRNTGYGVVLKWGVEPTNTNFSFLSEENYPMRAIPLDFAKSLRMAINLETRIARLSYCPPYWNMENYADCYIPKRG